MKPITLALVAAAALAGSVPARADLSFHVSLDTSMLVGQADGPFSLSFQFNDGSAVGDANNVATLSHFDLGGGAAIGGAALDGGASGSLASGLKLVDSSFYNAVTQAFSAGRTLGFDVSMSTLSDPGGTPDEFSFGLLEASGNGVTTTGLGDVLVVVDIDGPSPTVQVFAGSGAYDALGTPRIGPVGTVPEPTTVAMWSAGLMALFLRRRRPT